MNLMLPEKELATWHEIFFENIKCREDIIAFEQIIKDMETSFDECPYPIFHSFADGMYTREMHARGGDLIVGAIHRNEYFVNVLQGHLWVVSEFGAKEIKAPASFKVKAGTKNIGFTLEDTVWVDTHKVSSNTVEEAEKEIFVDSYEEFDRLNNTYDSMCHESGHTPEQLSLLDRSLSCQDL